MNATSVLEAYTNYATTGPSRVISDALTMMAEDMEMDIVMDQALGSLEALSVAGEGEVMFDADLDFPVLGLAICLLAHTAAAVAKSAEDAKFKERLQVLMEALKDYQKIDTLETENGRWEIYKESSDGPFFAVLMNQQNSFRQIIAGKEYDADVFVRMVESFDERKEEDQRFEYNLSYGAPVDSKNGLEWGATNGFFGAVGLTAGEALLDLGIESYNGLTLAAYNALLEKFGTSDVAPFITGGMVLIIASVFGAAAGSVVGSVVGSKRDQKLLAVTPHEVDEYVFGLEAIDLLKKNLPEKIRKQLNDMVDSMVGGVVSVAEGVTEQAKGLLSQASSLIPKISTKKRDDLS